MTSAVYKMYSREVLLGHFPLAIRDQMCSTTSERVTK